MAIANDKFSKDSIGGRQRHVSHSIGSYGGENTQDVVARSQRDVAAVSGPDAAESKRANVIAGTGGASGEGIAIGLRAGIDVAIAGGDVNVSPADSAEVAAADGADESAADPDFVPGLQGNGSIRGLKRTGA